MNIDALQRDLKAKTDAIESTLKAQMTAAETEKRERTAEERKAVETLLAEARDLKARIDLAKGDESQRAEIARLTAGVNTPAKAEQQQQQQQPSRGLVSMGHQFVASAAYDFFRQGHHRSSSAWRSPSAELFDGGLFAATLTEDSASGGSLLVTDMRPGILELRFKRLVVADLLASGTTDSNSISYMKETTFTNAAAPVAEAAAKPESTLIFGPATDPVQKIAHWLPVTEEMLEDVAQIRSYIDSRLRFGVQLAEEDQLLNGSGTPPAIRGILNRTGLTAAQAMGADTPIDAVFKEISKIATTAFVDPDGIVMNPANWQVMQLAKDSSENYLGSGPFAAPQSAMLWGLRVVQTPTIAAGTALVGAFGTAAQVFRKGGLRVEASNSHSDFFIKNLVAIRAEERLALAVYRPAAFGTVTGLT